MLMIIFITVMMVIGVMVIQRYVDYEIKDKKHGNDEDGKRK